VLIIILSSCSLNDNSKSNHYLLTDSYGRDVLIPDTVESVICLGAGALRLLCYIDVTEKAAYIEGNEKRRTVPYLIANPGLRELDIIGAGNNYDAELLAAGNSDLIIATFMNPDEADKLQKATGKPVFMLNYGNLGSGINDLFNTIGLLGKIFKKGERSDSLIQFITMNIDNCKSRTSWFKDREVTAYIGGVAYSGSHGINATVPDYPPFRISSVRNAAESLNIRMDSSVFSQENLFIDTEQIIKWDPDFIFLDASGISIWQNDLAKPVLAENLKAIRDGRVYTVLPYNWYSINYDNLLCNSWFIGKTVFPEAFSDITIEEKCREIYRFFLGKDIYDEIKVLYKPFHLYE